MLTERRVKKGHVANMVALFMFVCKQLRSFLLEYQRFFHTVNVACSTLERVNTALPALTAASSFFHFPQTSTFLRSYCSKFIQLGTYTA